MIFLPIDLQPHYGNGIFGNVYLLSLDNTKVNQLFEKSHILVHTGFVEGFPNTFIQAWMRKMVVLSLQIDPDNVLTSKKIGFLGKNFDNFVTGPTNKLAFEASKKVSQDISYYNPLSIGQ